MNLVYKPSVLAEDITRRLVEAAIADWVDSDGTCIEIHLSDITAIVDGHLQESRRNASKKDSNEH